MFLADSNEKDRKEVEQEKKSVLAELESLRKINSIVETLAKVVDKA